MEMGLSFYVLRHYCHLRILSHLFTYFIWPSFWQKCELLHQKMRMDIFDRGSGFKSLFLQFERNRRSHVKMTNWTVQESRKHNRAVPSRGFKSPTTIRYLLASTVLMSVQIDPIHHFNHPHFRRNHWRNYQKIKKDQQSTSQQSIGG